MKIYFAGSIRGGREDKELYGEIIQLLSKYGTVLTEHISDKNLTEAGEALDSGKIYNRDISWLSESDIVIAEVSMPSLGVGYEVAKAESMGKEIVCIYRNDGVKKISAMIAGNPNITKKEYTNIKDLEIVLSSILK
jgi:2'-deoxynucleoside 5'-phosphate N-hydrolase